ncbi:endonuclease [Alishewanella sp. 16-MA]|uniref:Endonuclease n=1 Tax=Alishewanella maricola TaxID=2795740 RepID=A0ABS8C792_9ALTE|nr:endonuclease [Alishewanella maricola]MCB5228157.1 endonuclease [Alishewanella maricola]
MRTRWFFASGLLASGLLSVFAFAAEPTNFEQAKVLLKQVYQDKPQTFYCDCPISWVGRSGGRVDHAACGFAVYSPKGLPSAATLARAARSEVEHIIPISWVGKQLQCWQKGGRKNCQQNDPLFNRIEADLFNLTYAVGQINGLRSDLPFGMVSTTLTAQFGQCDIKIDTQNRKVQPKMTIRGDIARVAFYMADRYNLTLSRQDQQLYMAWHLQDPVSAIEQQRHARTAALTGRSNPFISGAEQWSLGYKTRGDGLVVKEQVAAAAPSASMAVTPIYGNRRSKIYHRPDCPNYLSMAVSNRVSFDTASEAEAQGYRQANNCPK